MFDAYNYTAYDVFKCDSKTVTAVYCDVRVLHIVRRGTRYRSWLRHYATSRKFAGSSPGWDESFFFFFNLRNPSSRTMTLESTQPQPKMSTRNLPGGKKRPARTPENTNKTGSSSDDWIYYQVVIHLFLITLKYRLYSAISHLHNLQSTVAHALGLSFH
jgi:hypothetical protein